MSLAGIAGLEKTFTSLGQSLQSDAGGAGVDLNKAVRRLWSLTQVTQD